MKTLSNLHKRFKDSFKLGDGLFYKFKTFFVFVFISIIRKLHINAHIFIKLKLRKFGKHFYFYATDGSDMAILSEIFLQDEYGMELEPEPAIIFDLGSNVGLSVIFFKLKYPKAKIYAFEPDPETYKKLKKNTEQFNDVYCYNFAISDVDDRERFYTCPGSSMSSSLIKRIDKGSFAEVYVDSKKIDTIMRELDIKKIDLLKIDVEGYEFKILKEFKSINLISNIVGEVHLDLMNDVSKKDFLGLLIGFNCACRDISKNRFVVTATNKNSISVE